jgi:hypothetical protein
MIKDARQKSQIGKRDPTRSTRRIRKFEKEITVLFRQFKDYLIRDLQFRNERALEAPAKKPLKIGLDTFTHDLDQIVKALLLDPAKPVISRRITESYQSGEHFANIVLGATKEERMLVNRRISVLVENTNGSFKGVTDEVSKRIRATVADAILNEVPIGKVTRDIVRHVDGVGIVRATAMVRFETMKAVNTGVVDRYKDAGVEFHGSGQLPPKHVNCRCTVRVELRDGKPVMVWLAALDDKTCEVCGPLDGTVI